MKVYIVDDEEGKAQNIHEFMHRVVPECQIEIYRSFQKGLRALITSPPDLLLLDMTMPTYEVGPRESGGRDRRYAGREIVRQLKRKKLSVPVIVITQYEQFEEGGKDVDLDTIRNELLEKFPDNFVDAIYYNASDSQWMLTLERLVLPILVPAE